jgi:hypothetical protein
MSPPLASTKCVTPDVIVIDAISNEREKKMFTEKEEEEEVKDQLNQTSIGN